MSNLLPIFLKLQNEKCLVIGAGKIASQKINQLIENKAIVTVIAPEVADENIYKMNLNIVKRKYKEGDLLGFKLIIAATNNKQVNEKIFKDANKLNLLVNIVDQPDLCNFYMGSVYKDGDLKVAVSTNGKCPSFSTFIKNYIKDVSRGQWGKALNELAIKREKMFQYLDKYSDKKELMGKLVELKMNYTFHKKNRKMGKVYLVGAGPGDPELITSKGISAIKNADVILHDALVHPSIVFEINPLAKKIFVGKREDKHSVSQDTIHSLMLDEVGSGKIVVRLKGGDPFIFGRGGEELISLKKNNIPFEIIPGITAGIGAAAAYGIPLTHRDDATSTVFITGHQCDRSKEQDWEILAKLNTTLVVYMGTNRISSIIENLLRYGKANTADIAIIQNATLPHQEIILGRLDNIINKLSNKKLSTPAIIIIGDVVDIYGKIKSCLTNTFSQSKNNFNYLDFEIWKSSKINT